MVLSEKSPEDKQKLKSGIMAVAVLLAIGSFGPLIISEVTGVDVNELCQKETDQSECIEKAMNGEIKSALQEGLGWVSILVALISFVGLMIAGAKF